MDILPFDPSSFQNSKTSSCPAPLHLDHDLHLFPKPGQLKPNMDMLHSVDVPVWQNRKNGRKTNTIFFCERNFPKKKNQQNPKLFVIKPSIFQHPRGSLKTSGLSSRSSLISRPSSSRSMPASVASCYIFSIGIRKDRKDVPCFSMFHKLTMAEMLKLSGVVWEPSTLPEMVSWRW